MKRLLNDGWFFAKLPLESTLASLSAAPWQPVDLPHDWLIWQADDLYESSDAWYRRELRGEEADSARVILRLDGVYMDCDVLINGEVITSHAYGYTAFDAELTGRLKPGINELLVHIRHRSPNSRWYSGSGIFRDVYLLTLPETCLIPDSLYVISKAEAGRRVVRVSAELEGEHLPTAVGWELLDADNNPVAAGETRSEEREIRFCFELHNADLWAPDHPYLYTLRLSLDGQILERRIGLRDLRFDPEHGFVLNGRSLKLHGVCLHHDLGALGSAFHPKAARRQLQLMKDMGANAVRTSHNPPASAFLDLCDEMGILVVDEAFDMWERPKTTYDYARFFPDHEADDVASWIRRDRTHACVIMWSIGNEIYDMFADQRGTEVCRMLTEQVRQHDPEEHAAVTFGSNYMPWEGAQRCAEIVRIPGYNYAEKYYESHHRAHPSWVIYGSETGSVLSSRGIYHFPMAEPIMSEVDLQCSSLGNSNTSWGATDLRTMIVDDLNTPYSMGQFIWSGIDYIGEPTPYHTRSCYFGQADTACFPKDAYYLFQSLWTERPMIHIGVSWDWNPGQLIDIPVMTNCAEAELFLNGRSLGRKTVSRRDAEKCLPVWQLPFSPGTLRAVGYDGSGRVLVEEVRETSGESHTIRLEAEDSALLADGYDLTFLTIRMLDAAGKPVENARDRVTVSVEGGGRLLGLDNGDSTDQDGYKVHSRRLFSGKLLAIIGSTGELQDVKVTVVSPGKQPAVCRIPVMPAEKRPGQSALMRIPDAPPILETPLRCIRLEAESSTHLTPEQTQCLVRWHMLPPDADEKPIRWEITNAAGIVSPRARVEELEGQRVRITATGDGKFYLRALSGNASDHPEIISQLEIEGQGLGNPALNPYTFVSAGLYDISEGEIGAGNEKGISFARDGESMIGFRRVDLTAAGSDEITIPVFALDSDPCEIEMYVGDPREDGRLLTRLHYHKKSIWNVYQSQTWKLPERLTGVQTLCFRMNRKIHMKGFSFARMSRATRWLTGAEADSVYGDQFERNGDAILNIGNNVTLTYTDLDFADWEEAELTLEGQTDLALNAVTLRITGKAGESVTEIANFVGTKRCRQSFRIRVPEGLCTVSFVFLPGCRFDFYGFTFRQIGKHGSSGPEDDCPEPRDWTE